jgi:hypothetical protein
MNTYFDINKEEVKFAEDLRAFLIRHKVRLTDLEGVTHFDNENIGRDGEIYLTLEEVKEYYEGKDANR